MSHQITREDDLLSIRLHGNLTTDGLTSLARDIARAEAESAASLNRLTDMRESTGVELNFSSMLTFGQARTTASMQNSVKSALIAPDPILYGFARMFQTLNANPSITVAIFPDEDSARAWLRGAGVAPPATPWVPGR